MKHATYGDFVITALGHDGFRVDSEKLKIGFAFDPYDLHGDHEPVDYVFVSHPHFDHCDVGAIRKLLKPSGKVVAPECCRGELSELAGQVEIYEGKDKVQQKNLTYWAIPAYNINKFRTPTEVFHPQELGGVGFVVEVPMEGKKNVRFYHAGDTDKIPEMEGVKKIDVAFLPISGTFVMTLEEALQAAEMIEADLTIPMHFGKILGSVAEAHRFQNLLKDKLNTTVLSTESI